MQRDLQVGRDPHGHQLLVQQRLMDNFGPVYLTLLSVIQGVALADLAVVVAPNAARFTPTEWLLALVAFGAVITTWNQYTMHIVSLAWIADVRDAVFPFVLGALQLLLNHLIPLSLVGWLVAVALLAGWGALTTWHTHWRASKEAENRPLLDRVGGRLRALVRSLLGISALALLLAAVSGLGHLQATAGPGTIGGILALALALVVVAITGGLFAVAAWYWQGVVAYARSGNRSDKQAVEPGT